MPSGSFDSGGELLKAYRWSRSMKGLLHSLLQIRSRLHQKSPSETAPLTPEIVMLGVLQFGQERADAQNYLASKLAEIVSITKSRIERLLSEEFEKAEASQKLSPTDMPYSPELARIFRDADEVSAKTSIQGKISQRHLIAALLLPLRPGGRAGERCHLPDDVYKPDEFVRALAEHIARSSNAKEQDRRDEWNGIIARFNSPRSGNARNEDQPRSMSSPGATFQDLFSTYSFDKATQLIFEFIQSDILKPYSQFYPEITPRVFFFAAVLWAGNEPEFHRDTEELEGLVKLKPDQIRTVLISELNSQPEAERKSSVSVSPEMVEVAERAAALALDTTGERLALLRHLLAAAITFRNHLEYLMFTRLRIEAKRVIYGFLNYIRTEYPSDNIAAWTKAFSDTARLAGINLSLNEPEQASGYGETEDETTDEDFSPVIVGLSNKYLLEPQVVQLIQHALDLPAASGLGHVFAQITPTGILLAAVQEGRTNSGFHSDCDFLASEYSKHASLTDDSFKKLLLDELVRESRSHPAERIKQFPELMEDTLQFAQEFALSSTGKKNVSMRHLIAAICLLASRLGAKFKTESFQNVHLNLDELGPGFLAYALLTYPTDNQQAWRSEFTKVFRPVDGSSPPTAGSTADTAEKAQESRGKAPNTAIRIGARTHFNKTAAGDEVVLGVDGYAGVLAKLIRAADEKDLCLAIFGPWGRGKTFLVEHTINKLKAGNLPGNSIYETVSFSAWKYPSRPEVWIHLYETFFCELSKAKGFRSVAHTILSGLYRNGVAKLWLAFTMLMVTILPKGQIFHSAVNYITRFDLLAGAAVLFFFAVFMWEFWTTSTHLRRYYLSKPRHVEKLGLQATIGNDLKALLCGWVQADLKSKRVRWGFMQFYVAIAALIGFIYWRSHDALLVVGLFSAVLIGITFFIRLAFHYAAPSPSRLLLVVDDLDRCRCEHLLTVMESVKMLLEDDEISRRVQVIMLIEEDVLHHAIWDKYKFLTESNAQKALRTAYSGNQIVRENCEKLFTANLRLATLSFSDIDQIVMAFGGRPEEVPAQKMAPASANTTFEPAPDVPPIRKESQPGDSLRLSEEQSTTLPTTPQDSLPLSSAPTTSPPPASESEPPHEKDSMAALSLEEKQVILWAVRNTYGDKHSELGPRTLRALLFRYQLARLVLEELDHRQWSPALLAKMITTKMFTGSIDFEPSSDVEKIMKAVAQQVA